MTGMKGEAERNRSGRRTSRSGFAIAGFLAISLMPTLAAAKRECETEIPDKTKFNERIACRAENATVALESLIDTAEFAPALTPRQLAHLKAAKDRVNKARQRSQELESFKQLTKRASGACFVVECTDPSKCKTGNGDGVCQKGEDCLEVLGDQIGDDVQPCKKTGKKSEREVCVEMCDVEDEENFDGGTAEDVEGALEDLSDLVEEADADLSIRVRIWAQARTDSRAAAASQCDDIFSKMSIADYATLQGLQAGAHAAELAHLICESVGEQSVLGSNAAAVCAVTAGIAGALQAVFDGLSLEADNVDGENMEQLAKCVEELDDDLSNITGKLDMLSGSVESIGDGIEQHDEDIKKLLAAVQDGLNQNYNALLDVVRLMHTPLGRRMSRLPACGGKECKFPYRGLP